jgi:hypothetical protein
MKIVQLTVIVLLGLSSTLSAQNTVTLGTFGFTRITAPAADFKMLGSAFEVGDDGYTTLDEVLGTNGFYAHASHLEADKAYLWDNSINRYHTAFLNNDAWGNTNPNTDEVIAYKWCYMDGMPRPCAATNTFNIIPGDAVFMKTSANVDIAIHGNIPTASTTQVAIVEGYNMIMNPYPVATELSSIISTNDGAFAHASHLQADKIYLWNNSSKQYVTYFLNDAQWGATNPNTGEEIAYKWCYMDGMPRPATISIPAGTGFYYFRGPHGPMTWNSVRPYNMD